MVIEVADNGEGISEAAMKKIFDPFFTTKPPILTDLGYRVVTASDGEEAVAIVEDRGAAIDLAILDVVMPNMDGIAAAREMRRQRPDLKVVFLTAHDFARDMPERLQRSDETLLIKPCTVAALSRTVHDQLEGG